ncbi:hypothetical protein [Nonomuraea sp. NPDC059022]|uniref:hypothetical protein n=1 Tax=Nonomuraea sp. NPDC059022 TaxID=3346705 RepID=UPI0036A147E2
MSDRLDELMNASAQAMNAIRPPIPNIGRVAPRYGLGKHVIEVADVVRLDELYPGPKADPLSARPGYSGTEHYHL